MGFLAYKQLEKEYAKFIGSDYAVAVNSGTAALHLALLALDVRPGDEVIVPDFTMAACGFAVSYTRARVVTVDCDKRFNIDTKDLENKITEKTRAIMAVHIYGRLCDMEEINRIAKKYNIFVIEDACEAQGAKLGPADVTCHSFYSNKIVHAEEGGMITTNKPSIAEKANYLKNMAFGDNHSYFHEEIGYNYRMPEGQAQKALESLRIVDRNLKKRKKIEKWYNKYIPKEWQLPERDVVWVYDLKHPKKHNVVTLVNGSRFAFKPLSTMPMWKQTVGENALKASQENIYLPVHPSMSKRDVKRISYETFNCGVR